MTETYQFQLPLVQGAQAQKHVTINEALARLDAAAQLRLVSVVETLPPTNLADGMAFGVPTGAVNAWDGHSGKVAIYANSGWVFLPPSVGWSAWVEDAADFAIFDGVNWRLGARAVSVQRATTGLAIFEFEHSIVSGTSNATSVEIEDGLLVFGVTGRVTQSITGSGLTAFDLGVGNNATSFGSGIGLSAGSNFRCMLGKPQAFWGSEPLILTAVSGSFSAGSVRFAIHGLRLEPPQN